MAKTTPMMQQYLSIKEKYPDAILFYRMGDFYEMFYEDAEIASGILEITLTSRNKKNSAEDQVPMCGVPVRAVQGYIARIISNGRKVAICEQVEDPATAKGLVEREVVRVVTPGMVIDESFLDEKSNNFVLAVSRNGTRFGLAWLDISTGEFKTAEEADHRTILEEIRRVAPAEVVLPASFEEGLDPAAAALCDAAAGMSPSFMADRRFEWQPAHELLTGQFKTLSLEGFGCEGMTAGIGAAGALLHYVRETQRGAVDQLRRITPYFLSHYLMIDEVSARNLELFRSLRTGKTAGSLLAVLDKTITAMGGRRLKEWLRYPLKDPDQMAARLDAVAEAVADPAGRAWLRDQLKMVHDLERLSTKIVMGHCNGRDLAALKRSLQQLPDIAETLEGFSADLLSWRDDLAPLDALADAIEAAIRDDAPLSVSEGGMIREGYSPELDDLIRISTDGKGWLTELEVREKEATGIPSVKIRYNKVFGYYIEIPKSRAREAPDHYIRRQTLTNAERFITEELKAFESKVLRAEEERFTLEYRIFDEIRKQAAAENRRIQEAAAFVSRLDCLLALAETADQNGYIRPEITTDGRLHLEEARHPVIEKMITGERFVPNTIRMDDTDHQILIITGPNMAGKSTVLRQAALLTLMAQMGGFVPAQRAEIPVTDRIFTRVGALDNLAQGQSTFMVEMQETANILNNASPESLIILDEIGRGTSTYDGLSIAWAVAEHLHDIKGRGVKTLFATHYHELTALAETKPRVQNYHIAVKEWKGEIIFLRKLVPGGTNRSYGIQVARLAGIPDPVIQCAQEVLSRIETGDGKAIPPSDGAAVISAGACRPRRRKKGDGPIQLGLFGGSPHPLVDELLNLDLYQMTPLDAMNALHALQEKTKSLNG
jgi:DNA mismatch repair protein MutS